VATSGLLLADAVTNDPATPGKHQFGASSDRLPQTYNPLTPS